MRQELDYEKLGLAVKTLRLKHGLTQDALAEMVHCYASHISNIENNHTKVSLNTLLSIANALDTSIDSLLSEQYLNASIAIDHEILKALHGCDSDTKEKILRIIEVLSD